MEKAYRNTGYFMLFLIPLVIFGFYKTYFNQIPDFTESITWHHHLHAMIASIWILLLIVQPLLIRYKKYSLHRAFGKSSYLVFPLLILSFVFMTIRTENSIFFPLADCILLVILYSLAIYNRKNTPKHMRYMIGTAIVFLGPTIGRIGPLMLGLSEKLTQNIQYGVIYLILIGLIFLDKKNKKNFSPYLLIFSGWVVHQITFNLLF